MPGCNIEPTHYDKYDFVAGGPKLLSSPKPQIGPSPVATRLERTTAPFVSNRHSTHKLAGPLAILLSATLAIQFPGSYTISIGFILALLLSPTIFPALIGMAHGRALRNAVLAVALTAPFLVLVTLWLDPFRSFSHAAALTSAMLFISLVVQVVAVAWASSVLSVARVAILYGAGAILNAGVNPQLWQTNPWKYALAWPVSVLVITLLSKSPRLLQPVGIVTLALYALTHESRNSAGVLLLAFLATSATYVFFRGTGRRRGFLILGLLAGGTLAIVSVVTQLALNGDLGAELQHVQVEQSSSGTPIAGRVEYGATFALMMHTPIGLGPGVVRSDTDIQAGKSGLSAIRAPTGGEYVDGQMFANGFEVHSVIGDLWVQFGIAGLLFAGLVVSVLARASIVNHGSAPSGITALCAFLIFQAFWDLLFSPLYANFRPVGFATGVALFLISSARDGRLDVGGKGIL